uniref:phosphatidyl-N-methylethanolamine N-methyltransferase n=1 Tax=Chelonoidis abingdonii TaxID=106734 RepID=A0A8C0JCY9_CHEAB
MTLLLSYVKLTDSTFAAAVLCIAFNPLFWNVVARWEHKTRVLSRVCGSPYTACYCLGAVILLLNFIRSDYFGILKEEKVTSFPFNVMDNPMYWGSTACYLGWSIMTLVITVPISLGLLVSIPLEENLGLSRYTENVKPRLHKAGKHEPLIAQK